MAAKKGNRGIIILLFFSIGLLFEAQLNPYNVRLAFLIICFLCNRLKLASTNQGENTHLTKYVRRSRMHPTDIRI